MDNTKTVRIIAVAKGDGYYRHNEDNENRSILGATGHWVADDFSEDNPASSPLGPEWLSGTMLMDFIPSNSIWGKGVGETFFFVGIQVEEVVDGTQSESSSKPA